MNERLAKAEALFHEALELPPEQREAFLQQACGVDAALLHEVTALLRASGVADRWLKDPSTGSTLPGSISEGPGTVIGRYKLLQQIGEGGCGVVYMAEQNEPVRRRVALKVIKLGMDTKQVVARFEAERQALAMMDHPNIAKVLDAGATDTGRPYFVMELVRGIKITEYCDQNNLTTTQRLDLFIQICQAIQHAHQKGIIHRDLKPSNILVTLHDGVPVPKVIDFGIAKATGEQRLTDKTLFTAFQQFIGTPAYMSPEQAEMSGLDIDTRTDIYALGVLLYELLTGKTPFDAKELMAAGLDEIRRTIREQEPKRPSTRLTEELVAADVRRLHSKSEIPNPKSEMDGASSRRLLQLKELIHVVRGDLDWMVMKCLEKDRTRRYETASALALDLQRHFHNEPILARPPSNIYRFQKFIRRNKLTFAAATAVAAALVVGLGLSTWLFLRERVAVKIADANALRAEQQAHRAEQKAHESRRNLYAADMILAQAALEAGNIGRAKELLRKYLLRPGEKDLRGWEWRYAWNQCRSDALFTLEGHTINVTSLALSTNTGILASGSLDRTVRLWDLEKKQSIRILPQSDSIYGLAFSRNDAELIVGTMDGQVSFWNCETWQRVATLTNLSRVRSLRVSPDGKVLAVFGTRFVTVWNVADRHEIARFDLRPSNDLIPGGVAFSPDSSLLAYSKGDGAIVLWDLSNKTIVAEFEGHERYVSALAFSPDGSTLVSGSRDRTARLWDIASRKELRLLGNFSGWVGCIAFSPAGELLAVVGADQRVRLFETRSWEQVSVFKGHLEDIRAVVFPSGSRTMITAGKDRMIRCWPVSTNQEPDSQRLPSDVNRAVLSPDAKGLYLVHTNGTHSLWRSHPFAEVTRHPFGIWPVTASTVSQDGKLWAVATTNGLVKVLDHGRERFVNMPPLGSAIHRLAFSRNGHLLAGLGNDQTCRVWRVAAGRDPETKFQKHHMSSGEFEEIARFGINARTVGVFKFPGSGSLLGVGVGTGPTEIWDAASSRKVATLRGHKWAVGDIAISRDESTVATASGDGKVKVWDLRSAREIATLGGQLVTFFSVAFSPDESRLAACGGDGVVRLWDMETKQEVASLKIHNYPLNQLAFSSDDESLIVLDSAVLGDGRLFVLRAPKN